MFGRIDVTRILAWINTYEYEPSLWPLSQRLPLSRHILNRCSSWTHAIEYQIFYSTPIHCPTLLLNVAIWEGPSQVRCRHPHTKVGTLSQPPGAFQAPHHTMQAMPDARQQSFEEIYGPPENFLEIEVRSNLPKILPFANPTKGTLPIH